MLIAAIETSEGRLMGYGDYLMSPGQVREFKTVPPRRRSLARRGNMPVYFGMFRYNPHISRTQTLRDDYPCIQLPGVKVKHRKDYFARLVLVEPSLV